MDALDGGHWQFGDDSTPTVGVTYFAGTFVRHPLALAAAKAVLLHLKEQGPALQEAHEPARPTALRRGPQRALPGRRAPRSRSSTSLVLLEALLPPGAARATCSSTTCAIAASTSTTASRASSPPPTPTRTSPSSSEAFKDAVARDAGGGLLARALARARPPSTRTRPPVAGGAPRARSPTGNPAWFVPQPRAAGPVREGGADELRRMSATCDPARAISTRSPGRPSSAPRPRPSRSGRSGLACRMGDEASLAFNESGTLHLRGRAGPGSAASRRSRSRRAARGPARRPSAPTGCTLLRGGGGAVDVPLVRSCRARRRRARAARLAELLVARGGEALRPRVRTAAPRSRWSARARTTHRLVFTAHHIVVRRLVDRACS